MFCIFHVSHVCDQLIDFKKCLLILLLLLVLVLLLLFSLLGSSFFLLHCIFFYVPKLVECFSRVVVVVVVCLSFWLVLFLSWLAAGSCLEEAGQFAALVLDMTDLVHLHFSKLVSLECC